MTSSMGLLAKELRPIAMPLGARACHCNFAVGNARPHTGRRDQHRHRQLLTHYRGSELPRSGAGSDARNQSDFAERREVVVSRNPGFCAGHERAEHGSREASSGAPFGFGYGFEPILGTRHLSASLTQPPSRPDRARRAGFIAVTSTRRQPRVIDRGVWTSPARAASNSSPCPSTHSDRAVERRPVKNLAAMHPPRQES